MKAEEIAARVAELRKRGNHGCPEWAWALDTIEALLMNLEKWDEVYAGASRHRSQLLSICMGHESHIRRLTDERDAARARVAELERDIREEMGVAEP